MTLAVALAIPLGLSKVGRQPVFGLPLVHSGDEPHYLVILNSLIEDGDLSLQNQYDQAMNGTLDAGRAFAGAPLDHHTVWFDAEGARHSWYEEFDVPDRALVARGASPMPRPKPGITPDPARIEHSTHPPGLAFLLAPLVYPFRGTRWVEHIVLFLSPLVVFATALFLRGIFGTFSPSPRVVNAVTLVAVLGSPLWHFGRTFFVEPWLALVAAGALALAIRRNAYFLAGALIAIGMQMKSPCLLLAIPLAADRLAARDFRRLAAFLTPLAVGVLLVLVQNQIYFGSPWRAAQRWTSGNPVVGLLGLLASPDHGLFPFAPAALVALFGWRAALRDHRREATVILSTFALYVVLMADWLHWRGGYCYGPRLIVPVLGLVFVGLVPIFESFHRYSARIQRAITATVALSVLISAIGALGHIAFWDKHPLVEPVVFLMHLRSSP